MKSRNTSSAGEIGGVLEMAGHASHNGTRHIPQAAGDMPTLIRFVTTLAILAGIAYGAMYALVVFVEPRQGEMTVRIPAERLNPQQ